MASLHNRTENDMGSPLRQKAKLNDFDGSTPEGKQRIIDQSRMAASARLNNGSNNIITLDDAEAGMRALESAHKNGTLFDAVVLELGIIQTARYAPDGSDNAKFLTNTIVEAAANSEKGERNLMICGSKCDKTPITNTELLAIAGQAVPITQNMNPDRGIPVGTGSAAYHAYVRAAADSSVVTGDKTPLEFTQADIAVLPTAVELTRNTVKACFGQAPSVDLKTCKSAGERAAVHYSALKGIEFKEVDPAILVPLPDLPKEYQRKFAEDMRKKGTPLN